MTKNYCNIPFTNLDWKFLWEEEVQEQQICRPIIMSPQLKLSWSWSWDVTINEMELLPFFLDTLYLGHFISNFDAVKIKD